MAAPGHQLVSKKIKTIHDIEVLNLQYEKVNLKKYKGKTMIIINIASFGEKCELVYNQMNELQMKYFEDAVVLAFPCDQFGGKEPSSGPQLLEVMSRVSPGHGFTPVFTVFDKVEVNGSNAHPLFHFLRECLPFPSDDLHSFVGASTDISWSPVCRNDIASNYEKFIVDGHGRPVKRYSSRIQTVNLANDIKNLASKNGQS